MGDQATRGAPGELAHPKPAFPPIPQEDHEGRVVTNRMPFIARKPRATRAKALARYV
jgi:hypothetical protein